MFLFVEWIREAQEGPPAAGTKRQWGYAPSPWTASTSGEIPPDPHFPLIGTQMIYLLNLLGIEASLKNKKR